MKPNIFSLSAVEGRQACGANGFAPHAGQDEPDPDWQPL
jgi:hypothetical protein